MYSIKSIKMKKLILGIFLLILSSNLFSQESNHSKTCHKECFEFDGKGLNIIVYKKDNYQIDYSIDNGEWVSIEVNWINACKYSVTYLLTNMPLF